MYYSLLLTAQCTTVQQYIIAVMSKWLGGQAAVQTTRVRFQLETMTAGSQCNARSLNYRFL